VYIRQAEIAAAVVIRQALVVQAHQVQNRRVQIVDRELGFVGLSDFADSWPRELSQGMRKRVDLARVLACAPPVLLLDEPFAALDFLTKEEMQLLLLRNSHRIHQTILFVTHDVEEAIFVATRVAVMSPRPGHVQRLFEVPFDPRERSPQIKLDSRFLSLRRAILDELGAAS